MNKKLLNRFLVTTLGLASYVCAVGGVKASATQGRFESTDFMIRFLVDSGSGFVSKNRSDASVVKLQKLNRGSGTSNNMITLHNDDQVYKTGLVSSTSTKGYINASDRIKKLALKNSSNGSFRMLSKRSTTGDSEISAVKQLLQEFCKMIVEILLEILKLIVK